MIKNNCLRVAKYVFILLVVPLVFVVSNNLSEIHAQSLINTINLQGKIVRNDAGHEGLNVTTGSPACVLSGADTCDFQVQYYDAASGGQLLFVERFTDREIGQYGGVFELPLGSGSVAGGIFDNLLVVVQVFDDIYIEILFSPAGNSNFTETFTRMPMRSSAFAIRSKYSEHANYANMSSGPFLFHNAFDSSTFEGGNGMVYYDTTDSELKLYKNGIWVPVATGGSSLWSGADISVFSHNPSQFLETSGIATLPNFGVDATENRAWIHGESARTGFSVYSNYNEGTDWPLVSFKADAGNFSASILQLIQDGTGTILEGYKGSNKVFEVDNSGGVHIASNGILYIEPFSGLPSAGNLHPASGEGCLYTTGGNIYWDSACNGSSPVALNLGGASLWADAGTFTYLTSTTDNLILGANTVADATFFFDVSGASGSYFEVDNASNTERLFTILNNGNVGIGTSNPTKRLEVAGTNSTISNSVGDLTITPAENLVVSQGNVKIGEPSLGVDDYGRLHIVGEDRYALRLEGTGDYGSGAGIYFGDGTFAYIREFEDDSLEISADNGIFLRGYVNAGDTGEEFQIDMYGDLIKIKDLAYSWPTAHTTNGILANDGSGGLSWATASSLGLVSGSGSNGQIAFWSSSGVSGSNDLFWDSTHKRLGIGTNTPQSSLDIAGTVSEIANTDGAISILPSTGNLRILGPGTSYTGSSLTFGDSEYIKMGEYGGTDSNIFGLYGDAGILLATSAGTKFSISSDGKVGIGTDSPVSYGLDIRESVRILRQGTTSYIEIGSGSQSNQAAYIDLVGDATYTDYGARLIRYSDGANASTELAHRGTGILRLNALDAGSMAFAVNGTDRMTINSSGYVGVGISSPTNKLHINGTLAGSGSDLGQLLVTGSNTDQDVMINLKSPSNTKKSEISFTNATDSASWRISSTFQSSTPNNRLAFDYYNGTSWIDLVSIRYILNTDYRNTLLVQSHAEAANANSVNGVEKGPFYYTMGAHANALYFYWSNTTGVGYSTSISGTAMDLAEWYHVGASSLGSNGKSIIKDGEILCIDKNDSEKVVTCDSDNNEIIGIASTEPFMTMGNLDMDNDFTIQVELALNGRVPLIVSNENGDIAIGDSLTTSSMKGVAGEAMEEGKIVGTALQALETSSCPSVSSVESINWPEDDGFNPAKPCYTLPNGTIVGKVMTFVNVSWYKPNFYHKEATITESGWYRIAQADNNESGNIKITNNSIGSSQNINLMVDKSNISVLSNFTSGNSVFSKARLNSIDGVTYLEVYIENISNNGISVKTDNWQTLSISKVEDLYFTQEYPLSGIQFGISDIFSVSDTGTLQTSGLYSDIGNSINRWNDIYAKGAIRLGNGSGSEGGIRYNVEKQRLEFSNDGTQWIEVGDLTSSMVLSAEYSGAILYADGSENYGRMTSDAIETDGVFKNYYEWISDRETLQDYDILVRITLPSDFISWKEDAISLDIMTENSASVANNKVDIALMGSSGVDTQVNDGISKLPGAWERVSIKGADITECNKSNSTCTLKISMHSKENYFVRVGDITLNYNRGL